MTDQALLLEGLPAGLSVLDDLSVDGLVLTPFQDDRPLKGTAGYCDWRLNGRLSRMIQSGFFLGEMRETVLTDTQGRIGTEKVLLFGQGQRAKMDLAVFERSMRRMIQALKKARIQSYAVELPGIHPGPLSVSEAVPKFLDAAASLYPQAQVTLLGPYPRFADQVAKAIVGDKRISLLPRNGEVSCSVSLKRSM